MHGTLEAKKRPAVQSTEPTKGERTRQRLMDLAEDAVMHKGFAATSIEELVDAAGITKSGFFYHFQDKDDLAKQLVARFIERDTQLLDGLADRARSLSDDPLQSFLIFLKLFAEMMDDLPNVHPGCLVASVIYQDRAFKRDVSAMAARAILLWRERFHAWLSQVAERYPPKLETDLVALADHFSVVADGAIVTSRALHDKAVFGRQARLLHDYVKLLFDGR
jgi:AcrR family transcriptional regulator